MALMQSIHGDRNKYSVSSPLLLCSVFVLVVGLSTLQVESKPINFGSILTGIVPDIVSGVYKEGDIDLFDYPCQFKRIPYIKRWELHYKAEIRCLGWTPIVGKARDHRNPTNAEQDAIKDFVRQALEEGIISKEQAKPWLE